MARKTKHAAQSGSRSAQKRKVLASARNGQYTVNEVDAVIKGVHVKKPRGAERWIVTVSGGKRPIRKMFQEKDKAVEWASGLAIARKANVFVHFDGDVVKVQAKNQSH